MNKFDNSTIERAKSILIEEQQASVSLLQRHFRTGYALTQALMSELERNGVVTPINENGFRDLAPYYRLDPENLARKSMDDLQIYMRRVRRTVDYFFQMVEEGNAGDTRIIGLLKPTRHIGNTDIRNWVLRRLERPGAAISDTAVGLHREIVSSGWAPSGTADLDEQLNALCISFNREQNRVTDASEKVSRAFRRVVRYLQELAEEDPEHESARAHSRIFEYFIPADCVPRGVSRRLSTLEQPRHGEHVVPCAYIRQQCLQQLRDGSSIEQVAAFVQRCLAIVDITVEEADRLDLSPPKGMGWKDVMPPGWDPYEGSIFDRLKGADIDFYMLSPA